MVFAAYSDINTYCFVKFEMNPIVTLVASEEISNIVNGITIIVSNTSKHLLNIAYKGKGQR